MQIANIKTLTDRVISRGRGLLPDVSREKIEEAILKSPLLVCCDRIVGYVQQAHLAVFFSVPLDQDAPIRTSAYNVGDGVYIKDGHFEFIDDYGIHLGIRADTSYTVID